MEKKYLVTLSLAVIAIALSIQTTSASPYLKELPSITTDTLTDYYEPETAESVGPVGAVVALSALSRLRGMFRESRKAEESQGISYYLAPMRIAKTMGSGALGAFSMAKTFYDTFHSQLAESMRNIQVAAVPEASSMVGAWENAPENQWMSGI